MGRNIIKYIGHSALTYLISSLCVELLRRGCGALHCNILSQQLVFCLSLGIMPSSLSHSDHYSSDQSIKQLKKCKMCIRTEIYISFFLSVVVLTHNNTLISFNDVITLSFASFLHPHHHLNTWWPRTDETVLNGIQSLWPRRPYIVINHSLFWNTNSLLMSIRCLNMAPHDHVQWRCCFAHHCKSVFMKLQCYEFSC